MLVGAHKNPTAKCNTEYNTPGPAIMHRSQRSQRRAIHGAIAFCESPGGMRREGPRFAGVEYYAQITAGQVHIWVGLLSYGQDLAYPIVREQMCQISKW